MANCSCTYSSRRICHLSTFRRFAHTAYVHIHILYFFFSRHKQLNGDLKDITFLVLAVHEQVALMSSSQSQTYGKLKTFHMSPFNIYTFCTHYLCSHIYFFCSRHKQLNGDLKRITFVVLAVHEQVALMSFSQSKTRLLLHVHEQFAMSLHLLCSTILHLWLLLCANNSVVES